MNHTTGILYCRFDMETSIECTLAYVGTRLPMFWILVGMSRRRFSATYLCVNCGWLRSGGWDD